VPACNLDFIRDSLGTAINHGFVLAMVFGAIGITAAIVAGPGRYAKPAAQAEQPVASHIA
jgi:hypothetical protein